jgi:eukaryotic-like serine/threonine-protein kinase
VSTHTDRLNASLTNRYTVERELGQGGMATVYLAHDVKHKRKVALKVLKPELGAVLGVERFLSEIQVTANLQHPNLLPLFDSGEADGLLFYVMPFVEGETLRRRIDREKQFPVDEAVRIAVAIAGALEYAHQNGVIHRDMKPENVLLQAGQPVIADFGIALAVSNAGGARVTQTGLSLGTPQYMSPEQATGDRVIDGRTDIYSLAAMTYEMLTGEAPHTGTSAQAIIAKLMTEEVRPLTVLRRNVPVHVDAAVRHGLEKLAADRFATAGDFALALTGARPFTMTARGPGAAAPAARAGTRTRVLIASLAVIAASATAAAVWLGMRPAPRPVAARFTLGLPDSVTLYIGGGTKLALSKDGTKIVFVGTKNGRHALYLRRIDDPVAQPVRGGEIGSVNANISPTFSPQGDWIVFEVERVPKKIPAAGGTAQTLADSGGGITWGDRGVVLFQRGRALWIGTSEGRDARMLVSADTAHGVFNYLWPEVLPGGNDALVTINRAPGAALIVDSLRLGIVALSTGAVTDLGVYGTNAHYASTGHIVFGRAGNLVFVAPFSLRKRAITGRPSLLLENIWQGTGGATGFTVSDNGALAYHEGAQALNKDLVAVSRSGTVRRIPGDALNVANPRVSPDGRTIAASLYDTKNGQWGVSLVDVNTGAHERLTPPDSGTAPEWTRDGARVVFARRVGANDEYVSRARDRSSVDTVLGRTKAENWSAPGDLILGVPHGLAAMGRPNSGGRFGVQLTRMDSIGAFRPFAVGSAESHSPHVSADGRLLAWVSDESGSSQVYVQPISGGARIPVSVGGGTEPLWSRAGTTLFYRTASTVMSAEIGGSPLRVTRRDSLFADAFIRARKNGRNWDVFPDGKEFLMVRPQQSTTIGVFVVLNWPQLKVSAAGGAAAER